MPVLPNARHEKFAQEVATGKSAAEAYILAGFKPSRQNASRLRANEDINARVQEIQCNAARSCEVSIESIFREIDDAIAVARERGQAAPMVNAASLRAKLAGLLVDRSQVEITQVEPRRAPEEILAEVARECGPDLAIILARHFEHEIDQVWLNAASPELQTALRGWQPRRRYRSPPPDETPIEGRVPEWQPPKKAKPREI